MGRTFLGVGILGSGIQQVVTGHFVRLVPGASLPSKAPSALPYLVGGILIGLGVMIVLNAKTRLAACLFGALLFTSFCFQHVPLIVAQPQLGFVWTNPLKVLTLVGAALLLLAAGASTQSVEHPVRIQRPNICKHVGRISAAIFFLVCGTQHFAYANFAATLVPQWLPGPMIWTYITGVALFAGGAGLLLPRFTFPAGFLLGVMIFLWVLMLHLPRALSDLSQAGEMSAVFEAVALSGAAFLAAGSAPERQETGTPV